MKEKIASFLVKTKKMCVPLPLLCSLGKKYSQIFGEGVMIAMHNLYPCGASKSVYWQLLLAETENEGCFNG